jgi:hypothetical protein
VIVIDEDEVDELVEGADARTDLEAARESSRA